MGETLKWSYTLMLICTCQNQCHNNIIKYDKQRKTLRFYVEILIEKTKGKR